jgi:hypothetical protein
MPSASIKKHNFLYTVEKVKTAWQRQFFTFLRQEEVGKIVMFPSVFSF